MNPEVWIVLLAVGVFVGMVGCLEVGCRLGRRMLERRGDSALEGTGEIEAAVFGFFGVGLVRLDAADGALVELRDSIR